MSVIFLMLGLDSRNARIMIEQVFVTHLAFDTSRIHEAV